MAIIGMDIHRAFAEVVALEGKSRRRLGRIVMRCDRLAAFAAGLTKDDIVVVEATGDATAVAEVVLSENPIRLGSRVAGWNHRMIANNVRAPAFSHNVRH